MAFLKTAITRTHLATNLSTYSLSFTRCIHAITQPPPLNNSSIIIQPTPSPPLTLPESERIIDPFHFGFGSGFHVGFGSMDLMAVPKRKTSPHKRGIRNGPKALKPIPVIIRCKVCGRVKLPHFYCCSGIRDTDAPNDSTS